MSKLDLAKQRERLLPELNGSLHCWGFIGDGAVISWGCTDIGRHYYIGANAVIGARGEEYAFEKDGTPKHVAHTGSVCIGDYVSIGPGVVVNRGLLNGDVTIIEDHAKIAGVNVNHNCHVGRGTVISAGVAMAGSCDIGDYCFIGVGATLSGVKIADYTLVGAGSVVVKDTDPYDVVVGNPARFVRRRNVEDYFGK